jgi:hypothetical protein
MSATVMGRNGTGSLGPLPVPAAGTASSNVVSAAGPTVVDAAAAEPGVQPGFRITSGGAVPSNRGWGAAAPGTAHPDVEARRALGSPRSGGAAWS